MDRRQNIEAIYPLSPLQQGMLFHAISSTDPGVYVEQTTCTFEGDLDREAFAQAWRATIQQFGVLRTAFVWKSVARMLQVVQRETPVAVAFEDWRTDGVDLDDRLSRFDAFAREDRRRGFDLSQAPLLRLHLVRLADRRYGFVWTFHHLILDGWSVSLVMKHVLDAYGALVQGETPPVRRARAYEHYIAWVRKQDPVRAEAYWRAELEGVTAATTIALDRPREVESPEVRAHRSVATRLSREVTASLQAAARRHRLTLNSLLQGAWALVVSRYAGRDDVVFGTTVSGRPPELDGSDSMVGLLINTLPVRVRLSRDGTALDMVRALQARLADGREFEWVALVDVQGWSSVPRGTPLFETLFVFENYPVHASLAQVPSRVRVDRVRSAEQTNFPLACIVVPGDEIALRLAYDAGRFGEAAMARMLGHLERVVCGFAANLERPLSAVPWLSAEERQRLVRGLNDTRRELGEGATFLHVFDAHVRRAPEHPAVVFGADELSYGALDARANQLAHCLRASGVRRGTLVGVMVQRSLEQVVAQLGIMKAGGAFVPIDPALPAERIAFMLEDAALPVVVTHDAARGSVPAFAGEIVSFDHARLAHSDWPAVPPDAALDEGDLAYAIYTSGSTGRPKGALLTHGGLRNVIDLISSTIGLGASDRVLQFATASFDASVVELVAALGVGGTLCLAPADKLVALDSLRDVLREARITWAVLMPSVLAALDAHDLPLLRSLVAAGERCDRTLVLKWAPGRRFLNGYGPTETTICASIGECRPEDAGQPSIGRPIANTQIYILDRHGELAPPGVAGELCVGGAQLAVGYLGRPELTADRFVPDPFGVDHGLAPGARLYRSGDLARHREDGSLEFLGRLDHQVKIRGYRVELGEIESTLAAHAAVQEAVVVARDEGAGPRLVGYYVASIDLEADDLRRHLRQSLPEHMVPDRLVRLEAFPLTPAGKVDRAALPSPDASHGGAAAYRPPRTPDEEILCSIFAQVLERPRVGVDEDFFELGGHSIKATQLAALVRTRLDVELPLRDVFESPTPARLAERLRAARGLPALPPIVPASSEAGLPLSFAQQRLWFLEQLEPGSPFYGNPALFRVQGQVDVAAFERALNVVIERHEVLRTTFESEGGRPVAIVVPAAVAQVPVTDVRLASPAECEREACRLAADASRAPFDLRQAPLIRASLWRYDEDAYIAEVTSHHIASDGWSMSVLVRELMTAYDALSRGLEPGLPPLALQYADYAAWQRSWLVGDRLEQEIAHWADRLAGAPPLLDLPTDHPRPAVQRFRGAHHAFSVPVETVEALDRVCRTEGVTRFMVLLASLDVLLASYAGETDVCVGTPIANRRTSEIEPLIGCFVNTLVLRTHVDPALTVRDLLKRVREVALDAFAHQDVPFELVVDRLQPRRALSHSPIFQVMLVLNNTPRAVVEASAVRVTPIDVDSQTSRFDLTWEFSEVGDALVGSLEFNSDLFESATAQRLVRHLLRLLDAVAAGGDARVGSLSPADEAERTMLVHTWNQTARALRHTGVFHEQVEAVADAAPARMAVSDGAQSLTYGELDARANQLAWCLRDTGVGPGTLVGLFVPRSLEQVVGQLAVLKAGGAFVPLDPSYPAERVAFMVDDAALPVVLTTPETAGALPPTGARRVPFDLPALAASAWSTARPRVPITGDDTAYVIYTSGSTGRPKGALLAHRGLCNLAQAQQHVFDISPLDRVLQFAPISFDASVWETAMALGNGATLCLAPADRLAAFGSLHTLLRDRRVTVVTMPPSVLAALEVESLPDLRVVVSAGERCDRELVTKWARGRRFFNAYGPTETTVCASIGECSIHDDRAPSIGRPLPNVQLYVLDEALRPVPLGTRGELCVGGVGVARGYLARPDLTAEKFVPNPFTRDGSALYRTGDLVRHRNDGSLEFCGRLDTQIKLRGHRVEPAETEAVLRTAPGVRDVVVVTRPVHGAPALVAYVVLAADSETTPELLRALLTRTMPEYQVPGFIVRLDALPLTPSQKVDRLALPDPADETRERATSFQAPQTETERTLAALWAELIPGLRPSVDDSFFAVGGHSLLATQLAARVQDTFGVEISLRQVFEQPTIAGLAAMIDGRRDADAVQPDEMAALLSQVQGLSDEEVAAMLARAQAGDRP